MIYPACNARGNGKNLGSCRESVWHYTGLQAQRSRLCQRPARNTRLSDTTEACRQRKKADASESRVTRAQLGRQPAYHGPDRAQAEMQAAVGQPARQTASWLRHPFGTGWPISLVPCMGMPRGLFMRTKQYCRECPRFLVISFELRQRIG